MKWNWTIYCRKYPCPFEQMHPEGFSPFSPISCSPFSRHKIFLPVSTFSPQNETKEDPIFWGPPIIIYCGDSFEGRAQKKEIGATPESGQWSISKMTWIYWKLDIFLLKMTMKITFPNLCRPFLDDSSLFFFICLRSRGHFSSDGDNHRQFPVQLRNEFPIPIPHFPKKCNKELLREFLFPPRKCVLKIAFFPPSAVNIRSLAHSFTRETVGEEGGIGVPSTWFDWNAFESEISNGQTILPQQLKSNTSSQSSA